MDENKVEHYPDGYVPSPDEILDDLLVALGRVSRRIRNGASMAGLGLGARDFEATARVAANMAKIAQLLRNPVDDGDKLKAIVEKMRAEGVGTREVRN
jgi:hypothetical protein